MSFVLYLKKGYLALQGEIQGEIALQGEIKTLSNNSLLNINIHRDEQSIIKIQLKIIKQFKNIKKHPPSIAFYVTDVNTNIHSSLLPYLTFIAYDDDEHKKKLDLETLRDDTPNSLDGIINDYINPIYDGITYSIINN